MRHGKNFKEKRRQKAGTKSNIKQGQKAWAIPGCGKVAGHFLVITFFLN